jgi:uncharacterized membrane protein
MAMIILVMTALTTALITGLLYAYSCSVNIGLAKLPNETYIAAMQSINRAIQNLLFFFSFIGTLILLPVSSCLCYGNKNTDSFYLLLVATATYAIGTFGVTMFGNVPLNMKLDKFDLQQANSEEIAKQREAFELPWNRLHTLRTVASLVTFLLVIIACLNFHSEQLQN